MPAAGDSGTGRILPLVLLSALAGLLLAGLAADASGARPVRAVLLRAGWAAVLLPALLMACLPSLAAPSRMLPAVLALPHVDALSLPFLLVLAAIGLATAAPGTKPDTALACAGLTVATGQPLLCCLGAASLAALLRPAPKAAPCILAIALAAALLPSAWRDAALPLPVLVAAAGLMGLSLLPFGGARHTAPATPRDLAGLVAGACFAVRMLADWPSTPLAAPPAAFGGALTAAAGLLFALAGGLRALAAPDAARALGGMLAAWGGLALALAGLAAVGRADDLPLLALGAFRALALLLGGVGMALLAAILLLRDIGQAAGTLALDRAGGLAGLMPRAAGLLALSLAGACALPPLAGFAAFWLLLHAVLALPRAGVLAGEIPPLLALCGAGAASGLLLLAALRLGTGLLLGRPRTPRAAGAADPPPARLHVPLACLGVAGAIGLLPGAWLWLTRAAGWQAAGLSGAAIPVGAQPGLFALAAPGGGGAFNPAGLALLLAAAAGLVRLLARRAGAAPSRPAPAWAEGAPPAPPWMPFGDPATQAGPALFAGRLDGVLGGGRATRAAAWRAARAARRTGRTGRLLAGRLSDLAARHAMKLVLIWFALAALLHLWTRP